MEKGKVQVVTEDGKRPCRIQNELTVSQAEQLKILTESNGWLAKEKESLLKELEELKREVAHEKSQNLVARHEQNNKILDVLNTELSCVICSEIIIEAVAIQCGHIFCSHCISTWFSQHKNSRSCPTCRTAAYKYPLKISRLNNTIASFHAVLSEEIQSDRRQLLEVRNKAEQKKAQVTSAARSRSHRWTSVQAPTYVDAHAAVLSVSQPYHNPDQAVIAQPIFHPDPTILLSQPMNPRSSGAYKFQWTPY